MKNIVQASFIATYRCNAKCHMCNTWKNPSKASEELSPKVLEKLPAGLRVNVTGGEPMLRKDIEDIFEVLYHKSHLLELSTNGYYTDKIVRLAEKYPNILIRVSLEGLPELNDRLRGLPNGFDHALRTLLELKKTKCKNIGFSIVICDKNMDDLTSLHELCTYLDIELGNSVMHNSWYFHKYDNQIFDKDKAVNREKEFIASLLQSRRRGLKAKLKDYGRAYFNRSILRRFCEDRECYRPPCGAGTDFYFIDPYGNVTPCNGSDEPWVMGNLKECSMEEILHSREAGLVMEKVRSCQKNCCFIVTERHDMVRKPWKPVYWIVKNKLKLALDMPADFK